jgi:type I restriction enzyme S subunit
VTNLPFRLTEHEVLCSVAATLCVQRLVRAGTPLRRFADLAEPPKYGYTAPATTLPTATRLLRITDIKGGVVSWSSVPYCQCPDPTPYLLRTGDLLVARSGSIGRSFLVIDAPEGAVFASYMIRIRAKPGLSPAFAFWCLQSRQFWDQILAQHRGSAMPNVNSQMLANLEFPVPTESLQTDVADFLSRFRDGLGRGSGEAEALPPPLEDVPRIMARIEGLTKQILAARLLRTQASAEAERLPAAQIAQCADPVRWQRSTVADVILSIDAGWSPQCPETPARNGEWGVLRTTSVQWCEFRPEENKALPPGLTAIPALSVEAGDVLVTRAGPRKRVGVVAAVRNTQPRLMISDKLIRLRPDQSQVESRFLEVALVSPLSQEHLLQRKTGLADAQVNISQAILLATPIAFPSLAEQRKLIEGLDVLQAQVDRLRGLQKTTAAELDALLPSILDKAFKGGL